MLRELAERWVTALRSGDYKQGVGSLSRSTDDNIYTYCCLGVLLDLVGTEDEMKQHYFKGHAHNRHYQNHSVGIPQAEFRKRVGLDEKLMHRAIELNDAEKSFDTIANYIEEELL